MSFLSSLEKKRITIPEKYLQSVEFLRGKRIVRQGEIGDGCYLIDKGTVRIELAYHENRNNTTLGFLEAGHVLGEFSFLDGKARPASAYAETHVKARWFSLINFEKMCEDEPKTALYILLSLGQELAGKMREFNEKIRDYIFMQEIDQETQEILSSTSVQQESSKTTVQNRADSAIRLYGWSGFSGS
jgi:CRP-like cAMP-binding protein